MTASDNYAAWQTALMTWAETATGLKSQWENERQSQNVLPAFVRFSGPHQVQELGPDYLTWDFSAPHSAVAGVTGVRIMMILVKVISRKQSARDKAGTYLERARMALVLPSTQAALNAAGLAVADRSPIRIFDTAGQNDRMESVAVFELRLNVAPDALLGTDEGTIEHVEMTSLVGASEIVVGGSEITVENDPLAVPELPGPQDEIFPPL